jgi:predicted Rossmann fold nucleotide-binding protein DprA/Smf involved in DNA uptake
MKALKPYLQIREDLLKRRDEIETALETLESSYEPLFRQDTARGLGRLQSKVGKMIEREEPATLGTKQASVFDQVKKNGPVPKKEIARSLGMGMAAVGFHLMQLQKKKLVRKVGYAAKARWTTI